ncbi:hypothetical protein EIP86_009645 [Pleurotus ostreatoroseus]|nr:hypothetical protein EIP86_009645 [Pleurotus ostreatoroseus]
MDVDNPALISATTIPAGLQKYVVDPEGTVRGLLASETFPSLLDPGKRKESAIRGHVDSHFTPVFSYGSTDVDFQEIASRPLPMRDELAVLEMLLWEAIENQYTCFLDWRREDIPTPLYVITFWRTQTRALLAQRAWCQTEAWLLNLIDDTGGDRTTAYAAEDALATFESLGWGVHILGDIVLGISTEDLPSLLSASMLSDRILDAMIKMV